MSEHAFRVLVMGATLLSGLAVLCQVCIVLRLNRVAREIRARIEDLTERVEGALNAAITARDENRPGILSIAEKSTELSKTARRVAQRIASLKEAVMRKQTVIRTMLLSRGIRAERTPTSAGSATLSSPGGEHAKPTTQGRPWAGQVIGRQIRRFAGLQYPEFVAVLKETLSEWSNDNVPRLGASLAFYTLLSSAPILVIVIAVAAFVYGQPAAQGQLVWEVQDLVGPDRAVAIQSLIQSAYKPGTGLIATLFGVVTLALAASSVVVELRGALNSIWHVASAGSVTGLAGIIRLGKERCYSVGLVLVTGFLLLVSLVLNAWIATMGKFFRSFLPAPEVILQAEAFLISFLVITFLFAGIYKTLPDVPLKWSDVLVGASVTSFLFTVGKQILALYLGKTTLASTYGAAGSLVMVLVWVYYSAQLFFLGAEFTKVYARTRRAAQSKGVPSVRTGQLLPPGVPAL